jgi:hypothetical protein
MKKYIKKIILGFILLLAVIVVFKIVQNSACPKYKDCMPQSCPYLDEANCQKWAWSEEGCKKIDWYCKGRTEIVE